MTDDALRKEIGKISEWIYVYQPNKDECIKKLLALAKSQRAAGIREAAAIARTHNVYPQLNIYNGGPDWYLHGQGIAKACEARAKELEG